MGLDYQGKRGGTISAWDILLPSAFPSLNQIDEEIFTFALKPQTLRITIEFRTLKWEVLVGAKSLKMRIVGGKIRLEVDELH